MIDDAGKKIALWRYEVIAHLVQLDGPRGILKQELKRLARRTHHHPVKGPTRIGLGTLEEWYYNYINEGLQGLMSKTRKDRGKSRRITNDLAEKIEAMALSHPDLDGPSLLAELKAKSEATDTLPSLSSLYRFLKTRGLDQRSGPLRRDHRAFAFEFAGDCWQGDVMYGPTLPTKKGGRKKTYLIAILDDATRLICHAQFYFEQHVNALKDCLKQALLKRGVPKRLYFDNGKIFRSRVILHLSARLGIHVLHTRPYRPQGRAKLERWFLTVRRQFLARIDTNSLKNLEALNRLFFSWVEGEYHVKPHRGLSGEAPVDRWIRLSETIRPVPGDVDLDSLFLDETTRRVAKDGTLTLKGNTFEAGPLFIGQRTKVHFDPFDLRSLFIEDGEGNLIKAYPVDLGRNRYVRRNPPEEKNKPRKPQKLESLNDLAKQMEEEAGPKRKKEDPHGE